MTFAHDSVLLKIPAISLKLNSPNSLNMKTSLYGSLKICRHLKIFSIFSLLLNRSKIFLSSAISGRDSSCTNLFRFFCSLKKRCEQFYIAMYLYCTHPEIVRCAGMPGKRSQPSILLPPIHRAKEIKDSDILSVGSPDRAYQNHPYVITSFNY